MIGRGKYIKKGSKKYYYPFLLLTIWFFMPDLVIGVMILYVKRPEILFTFLILTFERFISLGFWFFVF